MTKQLGQIKDVILMAIVLAAVAVSTGMMLTHPVVVAIVGLHG